MSPRAAIVTLGCKTNQFESAAMAESLESSGYLICDIDQGADLVIVNTCTVTAATDSQSRNLIRRARRGNPEARIVVTGCYAQIDPEPLSRLPGVSLVIGNSEKKDLLDHLADPRAMGGGIRVADIRQQKTTESPGISAFLQRSRAFVQIQNGCDAFCSYCIIPYARGRSRSVPCRDILKQIEILSASGYKEVVLTGIHIGQYGQDFSDGINLLGLLKKIETSDFSGRLRLGSIEPTEIDASFCQYVLEQDWICPHFHIPLQAGHDEILARMNRHYSVDFYARLLSNIRNTSEDAAIGLDIIAGFPGETKTHFEATCQLLDSLPLTHLHVFPFSRRRGTPAASMPDQLPGDIIKERAGILRAIGDRKLADYQRWFVGRKVDVVIEGGGEGGTQKGLSQHYLTVAVPAGTIDKGEIAQVQITSFSDGQLSGEL